MEVGKCWDEVTRKALGGGRWGGRRQNPWVARYCDGSVDSCGGSWRFTAVRHRTLAHSQPVNTALYKRRGTAVVSESQ